MVFFGCSEAAAVRINPRKLKHAPLRLYPALYGILAEGEGFEPPGPFRAQRFSRAAGPHYCMIFHIFNDSSLALFRPLRRFEPRLCKECAMAGETFVRVGSSMTKVGVGTVGFGITCSGGWDCTESLSGRSLIQASMIAMASSMVQSYFRRRLGLDSVPHIKNWKSGGNATGLITASHRVALQLKT